MAEKLSAMKARLFSQQLAFVDDPSLRKNLLCPRRAGKTYALCVWLLEPLFKYPNAMSFYVTTTKGHAKRNIWRHLKQLNDEFELGAKFHNTEYYMELPTGGRCYLGGAQSAEDIDRYRGIAIDRIAIDECASFPGELLDEFVYEVVSPCLWDRNGQLTLSGTPGNILAGPFYESTRPEAFGIDKHERRAVSRPWAERVLDKWQGISFDWSFHRWTTEDNTAMPQIWENAIAAHASSGTSDQDPKWIREGLGRWIADSSSLVYKYDPGKHSWLPKDESKKWGLPDEHDWVFIAGVDLGYDDDFDLEVAAYSETCDQFFHVYSWQSPGLNIEDIAKKIREVETMFGGFESLVGDRAGLGKTIFATLSEVYGVNIIPAEKHDKRDYIELLNSDLINNRCKILRGTALDTQLRIVQWDEKKRREVRDIPNHACDAFVYLTRWAYHHFAKERIAEPEHGTVEWYEREDERAFQKASDEYRARMESRWWDELKLEQFDGVYEDPWARGALN